MGLLRQIKIMVLLIIFSLWALLPALADPSLPGNAAPLPGPSAEALPTGEIELTRRLVMQQYAALWSGMHMRSALESAVGESVDERTRDIMWGTKGYNLLTNRNEILEKIQSDIAYKFNPAFLKLLAQLQQNFSAEFNKNLVNYFKQETVAVVAAEKNPMERAYIRQTAGEMLENEGALFLNKIRGDVSTAFPDLYFDATALGVGLSMLVTRYLVKKAVARAGASLGGAVLEKVSASALSSWFPAVGWFFTIMSVIDIGTSFSRVPEEIKDKMKSTYGVFFEEQLPKDIWEAMKPLVETSYRDARANLEIVRQEAQSLADDDRIRALTANLSDNEKQSLAIRLTSIARLLHVSANDASLLDDFGHIIRDASADNFAALMAMLSSGNNRFKQWFRLLGQEYFELYKDLPAAVWDQYRADTNSAAILKWASTLPRSMAERALKLSPAELQWIIGELPAHYLTDLFDAKNHSVLEIPGEIERLRRLYREDRRPWMGGLEFFYLTHRTAIRTTGALVFLTLLLAALKRIFTPRRSRQSVININVQQPAPVAPAAPVPGPASRKKTAGITVNAIPDCGQKDKTGTSSLPPAALPQSPADERSSAEKRETKTKSGVPGPKTEGPVP